MLRPKQHTAFEQGLKASDSVSCRRPVPLKGLGSFVLKASDSASCWRPVSLKGLGSFAALARLAPAQGRSPEVGRGGALSARFLQKNNNVSLYPLTALALAACGGSPSPPPPFVNVPGIFDPGLTEDGTAPDLLVAGEQTLTLEEGTIGAVGTAETATGYTVSASDEDGDSVTLSVDDDRFTIADDGSLNIEPNSVFDFETENPITLTITATDDSTEELTDTAEVIITIVDIVEAPALEVGGESTLTEGVITAETPTGYTVRASDEGGDSVSFTITDADGNVDTRFAIVDGALVAVAGSVFDFETEPTIALRITARDNSPEALATTRDLTITVVDLTGDPTNVGATGTQETLNEGRFFRETDTGLTVSAIDPDGDDAAITFAVDDTRFTIAANGDGTGTLNIVAGSIFDFEATAPDASGDPSGEITLTITATDGSENALATTGEVTITVTDVAFFATDSAVLTDLILRVNSAPAFGDVDGDGDLDLLVGRNDGNFDFYRWGGADGTGSGWTGQNDARPTALATSVGAGSRPGFGDYDGDGDIDLLVGEAGPGQELLNLFRRNVDSDGNTDWSAPTSASIVSDIRGSSLSSAFGDVDGDGDLDLVFGTGSGVLRFFRWGDAVGTEGSTGWSQQSSASTNPFYVINPASDNDEFDVGVAAAPAFFDVDGDGDLDVLVGNGDGVLAFFRRGTATDGADADSGKSWSNQTSTMDVDGNPINPFYVADVNVNTEMFDVGTSARPAFGDVDNDGDLDLVIGESFGNLNIWYWNDDDDIWQTTSDL